KYSVISSNLFRLTQGTNYDTANFSNPYLIERKLLRTQDAQNNNIFSSANNILNSTFIGTVRDNLVKATDAISNSFFRFANDDIKHYFFPIIDDLGRRRRLNDKEFLKAARKVEQSFISYLIQNSTRLNERINELLIDDKTSLSRALSDLKVELSNNPNSKL